jgi:hypothetical protein
VHIGAAQVRSHNSIWHCGITNAHMGNLPLRERLVVLGTQNDLARIPANDVGFK